jgi:flagellar hook-basal body complex protein FliE
MSNSISGLPPIDPGSFQNRITQPGTAEKSGFLDTLRNSLDQAQQVQGQADQKVSDLLNGKGEDVHSVMIAVEKADLSFQLAMNVRNKIVQAYQQISNLQF